MTKYQSHLSNIQQFLICQHFLVIFFRLFGRKGSALKPGGDTHPTLSLCNIAFIVGGGGSFLHRGIIQSFTAFDLPGAAEVDTG